jgi:hypothetical protein
MLALMMDMQHRGELPNVFDDGHGGCSDYHKDIGQEITAGLGRVGPKQLFA